MQKPISLSADEKIRFMGSLYSIFYRDEKIDKTEGEVLRMLGQVFLVHQNQYRQLANPSPEIIANEINSISDIRVRIYFMSIIHEVYRKEIDTWIKNIFPTDTDSFLKLYASLSDKIKLN